MPSIIRIKDGVVENISETVISRCTEDEFIENIKRGIPIDTGLLPKNCIYMQSKKDSRLYILELPPKTVNINYTATTGVKKYRVSIPVVQAYVLVKDKAISMLHLSCTKSRIQSLEDNIYILPLLNQHSDGNSYVCTGDIKSDISIPISKRIEKLVNAYFMSNFNSDLTIQYPAAIKNGLPEWDKKTKENPLFGISEHIKYTPHKRGTVKEMINFLLGN